MCSNKYKTKLKLEFQCWKLKLRVESTSKKDFNNILASSGFLMENFKFNKPLRILVTRSSIQNTLYLHWLHIRPENRLHHISSTPLTSQPVSDSSASDVIKDHSSWVWVQQDLKAVFKGPPAIPLTTWARFGFISTGTGRFCNLCLQAPKTRLTGLSAQVYTYLQSCLLSSTQMDLSNMALLKFASRPSW